MEKLAKNISRYENGIKYDLSMWKVIFHFDSDVLFPVSSLFEGFKLSSFLSLSQWRYAKSLKENKIEIPTKFVWITYKTRQGTLLKTQWPLYGLLNVDQMHTMEKYRF